jgi:hypothetical protein
MVLVASLAATAACTMVATIRSIFDRTSSSARTGKRFEVALGPSIIDRDVATFDIAVRAHPFKKGSDARDGRGWGTPSEITNPSRLVCRAGAMCQKIFRDSRCPILYRDSEPRFE